MSLPQKLALAALVLVSACDTNRYLAPVCTSENYESIAGLAGDYMTLVRDDMNWQDLVKISERDVGTYRVRVIRTEPPNPDFPFSATPRNFEFHTCSIDGRIVAEMKAEHHTHSLRLLEIGEDAIALVLLKFDVQDLDTQAIPYNFVDRVTPVVDNRQLAPQRLLGLMKFMSKEILLRDR